MSKKIRPTNEFPNSPEFIERVRLSSEQQAFLKLIGARPRKIAAGEVEVSLPFREDLTQQHGYVHAGVITTLADVACGYAAYTLMPADSQVLSVEFKVNLLRPAVGDYFVARARVLKRGKTLTVAQADVFSFSSEGERQVAIMLATLICR